MLIRGRLRRVGLFFFFWLWRLNTLSVLLLITARADAHVAAFSVDALLVLLGARRLWLGTLVNICAGALCVLIPAGASLALIRTLPSAAGAHCVAGFAGIGAFRVEAVLIFFTRRRIRRALVHVNTSFLVVLLPAFFALVAVLTGGSGAGFAGVVAFCAQRERVVPHFVEEAVGAVQAELAFIAAVAAALSVAAASPVAVTLSISMTRSVGAAHTGIAVRSKRSLRTAHFDGFNAEPLVQIRMFRFPLEPPGLEMVFVLLQHAVALEAAGVTQVLHDLHQTDLARLIFRQFSLLPGGVSSAKILFCCSVKALTEVVSDLPTGRTGAC